MAYPEMWGADSAIIAVAASGGSDINFSAVISSIDIDLGDRDFESLPTIAGGRLEKPTPEADATITFEGYPIGMATSDADVFQRFYTKRASWSATPPYSVSNSKNRDSFRVAMLFCEASSITSAHVNVVGVPAERITFINCHMISVKPTYTDNEMKVTFKFKCAPFNASGTSNIAVMSNDGTSTLTGLAAYTAS